MKKKTAIKTDLKRLDALTDADINRAVLKDQDAAPLATDKLELVPRRRGWPRMSQTKVSKTIRYDKEVIDYFEATGKGWQTRMNDALRDFVVLHGGR